MPANAVTLTGGAVLHTYLATPNTDLAANVIDNVLGAFLTQPFNLETAIPSSGATPITNIQSATGPESYALTGTTGGTVLADATDFNDTLSVNQGTTGVPYVLVGNDANDTFNIGNNDAYVVTGAGNNVINVGIGAVDVIQDAGYAEVNIAGGTLEQQGYADIAPPVLQVYLGAGGTLHVPQVFGNDTITALGSATVYGGHGSFTFQGAAESNSTVYTGQGSETLFGGSGGTSTNLFDTSGESATSHDSLVGGSGPNVTNEFVGGIGSDTMVAGTHGSTDIFEFNATLAGGTHTIEGFSATDTIDITNATAPLTQSDFAYSGGNTIITLGHTTITVVNADLTATSAQIKYD